MDLMFNSGHKPQARPAPGADSEAIKDGSVASFVTDVVEASRAALVLVDFWAKWCGPCKQLTPALEKIARESKGVVKLVKIDVDTNQALAAQLRVQSVPTVYAFRDGRPVDAFAGALPESQLREFVARLSAGLTAAPSLDEIVAEARAVLAEGDPQTAAALFQQVIEDSPDHAPALAGLLRCLIALGESEQAEQMLAELPEALARHADLAAVASALELARAAGAAGDAEAHRRRLSADPDDHQARFDLALSYYAAGQPEAAVDELLELFRRDRAWDDDAARKQLVRIFEALGSGHPLVGSARRRLSSLMFA